MAVPSRREVKGAMHEIWASLRTGDWLDWPRIRRVCLLLAVAYVGTWAFLLSGPGNLDPMGIPVGTDFAAFYAVSRALLEGVPAASLYDPAFLNETARSFTGGATYVWVYPPLAFLPYWPLGLLPYLWALFAWVLATGALFASATWKLFPRRAALLVTASFPAVFVTSLHGHNALLVAGALGWGLVLLPLRPVAAGALFGLAAMKPHLALLVPVALVAAREWRAAAAAAGTLVALAWVTVLAFGFEPWRAFFESAAVARSMLELGSVPHFKICSVFSSTRLLGGSVPLAYVVQALASVGAAAAVAWLWRGPHPFELKAAALVTASLLAAPYLYDYDLVALGIAIAFAARYGARDGWLPWEKTALAAAWALPLLSRVSAASARVPLTPLVLGLTVALVVRRALAARRRCGTTWTTPYVSEDRTSR